MSRARLRQGLLVGVGLLFGLSIPWYREPTVEVKLWFGLPDWVAVALSCYVGAALLNAWAWSLRSKDEPDS